MSRMSTPAIRCTGLVKTYPGKPPVEAVRGLDLEVAPGECFGLLGPNGAGKTTTLEILEGLLDATAGGVADGVQVVAHPAQFGVAHGPSLPSNESLSDRLQAH